MALLKLLSYIIIFCFLGWAAIMFAARVLVWLSRLMLVSIEFEIAGYNSIRNINLKFKKGCFDVSIGKVKLTLGRSLIKVGSKSVFSHPKLHLLMYDIKAVIKKSLPSIKKNKHLGFKSNIKGKLLPTFAKIARFLSLYIKDLVVKVPNAIIEVKELRVDMHKHIEAEKFFNFGFQLTPLAIQVDIPEYSIDHSSDYLQSDCFVSRKECFPIFKNDSTYIKFEDILVVCKLGCERERLNIMALDLSTGDITADLKDDLLLITNLKSEKFVGTETTDRATVDVSLVKKSKKVSLESTKKSFFLFPLKVSFCAPKVDVKFTNRRQDFVFHNCILGINLTNSSLKSTEYLEEDTSHVFQLIFNEIHLLKGDQASVITIYKLTCNASVDASLQEKIPIKVGANLKIGAIQCNLIMSRLGRLIRVCSSGKNKVVLKETTSQDKPQTSLRKDIMWTCVVSAQDFTIFIYSLNDLPLYHGYCESSNFSANNVATQHLQLHTELSEIFLVMHNDLKTHVEQPLQGDEKNSASLMSIKQLNIDWGMKDLHTHENVISHNWKLVFSVDVTGMDSHFSYQQAESLIFTMISYKTLLKDLSPLKRKVKQRKMTTSNKNTTKWTPIMKVNVDSCRITLYDDITIDDTIVADPKLVKLESQDGTPRTATVFSNLFTGCNQLKFKTSVEIFCISLYINKEKELIQFKLERARSIYQDFFDAKNKGNKVAIFDIQKVKYLRRGTFDTVRSLFRAVDIALRWEPDVHLALYELAEKFKILQQNKKLQDPANNSKEQSLHADDTVIDIVLIDRLQSEMKRHQRDHVFTVDVENIKISAELADGVEAMILARSIFSENAKVGAVLGGFDLIFNEARVLQSSRLQISSIPFSTSTSKDALFQNLATKDWAVHGLDVNVCLPYRLQLRAIDDAFEEMLRGLKLATTALSTVIYPILKVDSTKKKSGTSKLHTLRLTLSRFTAFIEEEPLQGWLDEHHFLLKKEICELDTRLKLFDEVISAKKCNSEGTEPQDHCSDRKINYNGLEINIEDIASVQLIQEEIYKKAFNSYYQACKKIAPSEGSGACSTGFQSGFKPSKARDSLILISAINLDVTFTKIIGGRKGMIEFIKKVDPFCLENDIPFSKLYGIDFLLNADILLVQLRNYSFPIFSGNSGNCHSQVVLAQQATCFQPQVQHDVFIGKWRRVRMLKSVSGTTPALKVYLDLPFSFHKGQISYGVGYEPIFADLSYAFSVALRRAKLGIRSSNPNFDVLEIAPSPKKERSLPWWDDMRYYIHGKIGLYFSYFEANVLATSDPYEREEKIHIISRNMDIQYTDGLIKASSKDFGIYINSLRCLLKNSRLEFPCNNPIPFLSCPTFSVEVTMKWECESGSPLNHYLHALPNESVPRQRVYDTFRSLSLSLRWNISLGEGLQEMVSKEPSEKFGSISFGLPILNLEVHDLVWLVKWWNLIYLPPQKLRTFSRWPRFGVPRVPRSGNLSLDKVMTEFFLRVDSTPIYIKHYSIRDDDPANGLTVRITKLKCELCWGRGKHKYTFDCRRDVFDLVYHGIDLHSLKVYLDRATVKNINISNSKQQSSVGTKSVDENDFDAGFLLHSDYFIARRQTPKADSSRLSAWREAERRNTEKIQHGYKDGNNNGSDEAHSDPSDDDGFNVVISDSCQRIFVYRLKLLWTLENRDVIWSWSSGLAKAFEPSKPSPSRQYAQKKLPEQQSECNESETFIDTHISSTTLPPLEFAIFSPQSNENSEFTFPFCTTHDASSTLKLVEKLDQRKDSEDEGKMNFMVNVVQPQFNLHSEEASGRFLLAAASGRILARSFHSVLQLGCEVIEKALSTDNVKVPEAVPEMTWKRVELSAMLEQVQAHVAPTDVDLGAGIQWLPKIHKGSQKLNRTGTLLERVFLPCQMYFRYTRHRSIAAGFKVKPLKELSFNSPDIKATMASHQFHVMLGVLSSLLFIKYPSVQKNYLLFPSYGDDDEEGGGGIGDDIQGEIGAAILYGDEEIELLRLKLEQIEREKKLLLDDIRQLSAGNDLTFDFPISQEVDGDLWMIVGGKSKLVQELKLELDNIRKCRNIAISEIRAALRKASQINLTKKEKNKNPYAMQISMRLSKVVWSMIEDGRLFAEVEINDLAYDFDQDFKDTGIARFTIKSFIVRNGLPNTKSGMLLSAWNPPSDWGKNFMLCMDAKLGPPKDGRSPIELFQVHIYPLKIQLNESMYKLMWHYFFPEDEHDSQKRQEAWKVSTAAGLKRGKKSWSTSEALAVLLKPDNLKESIQRRPELRRTSSFDKTWEERVAESVANELLMNAHSSGNISSKICNFASTQEQTVNKACRSTDAKLVKSGRQFYEEKKNGRSPDNKRTKPSRLTEFRNVKISQVELLLTYEGSRFPISDVRLLMDTFHRDEFIGTWGRLFTRVKKHVIWGVLKSVTGMQGKKFKAKSQSQKEVQGSCLSASNVSLNGSESDQYPKQFLKRSNDGAGEGFVTSIRGLFSSQRRKAKAFVLQTMRGELKSDLQGDWSEGDAEISPFARQLTIAKAKKLIRQHTKKFHPKRKKSTDLEMVEQDSPASSSKEALPFADDWSDTSSNENLNDRST